LTDVIFDWTEEIDCNYSSPLAMLSPFKKGGLKAIYLIKSALTPLFQRGGTE
jgi:hypothetical protein